MELDLKDGMCRCCASEGSYKDFTASYQWMGVEEVYSDMLKDCFDITLSTSNMNNGGICEVCITQLRNAFNFKKQVLNTEEQFKKLQENLLNSDIVKIEEVQADVDDTFEADDMDADFSGSEYDLPIKLIKKEKYEESKPKKRTRASTSKSKKNSEESGETSAKRMLHSHKNVDNDETADAHEKKRAKNRSEIGEELRKHRFNLEQILRNSNITPIRCHRGYGYVCCFCAKEFPQPADLKTHTLQVHSEKEKARLLDGFLYKFHAKLDITGLECSICANTIDTLEEFINHLHKIHDIKMHMDIKNQLFPFKFDNDELRCCICHNKYQKFKSLLEHMNVHYRNFICPDCNAGFINRSILAEHSKKHMLGVFACGICSKVFDTLRKKQSHEKFVHDDEKRPNKCGHCGEKFKDYRKKEEHLVSVHGVVHKRPECEACSRSFKNQKDYNLHIRRLHLMDKRHKCPNCDMAFFTTGELKSHVVKHTGAKGFQCAVCHKSYGRRKTLIEHMRIHNNDKRFKCERCGVAFVQKCRWRGHMWTKHEEHV